MKDGGYAEVLRGAESGSQKFLSDDKKIICDKVLLNAQISLALLILKSSFGGGSLNLKDE